jgi:hypothetical protein
MATNKPAHEIRLGRVVVTLWRNEGRNGVWYTATLARLFKDEEDKWRSSQNLTIAEMPIASKALDLAWAWCLSQEESDKSSEPTV